jgi:uncharacterized membrane protein YkgB
MLIKTLLVSTTQLTIILLVTAAIFIVFIAIAIIKMYKLKAENKRLLETNAFNSEIDKEYKDFTESHLYDSN